MNKYVRLNNNERLESDIRLLKKWWGFNPDSDTATDSVIKCAITAFLMDRLEGYDVFSGKVMPKEEKEAR